MFYHTRILLISYTQNNKLILNALLECVEFIVRDNKAIMNINNSDEQMTINTLQQLKPTN